MAAASKSEDLYRDPNAFGPDDIDVDLSDLESRTAYIKAEREAEKAVLSGKFEDSGVRINPAFLNYKADFGSGEVEIDLRTAQSASETLLQITPVIRSNPKNFTKSKELVSKMAEVIGQAYPDDFILNVHLEQTERVLHAQQATLIEDLIKEKTDDRVKIAGEEIEVNMNTQAEALSTLGLIADSLGSNKIKAVEVNKLLLILSKIEDKHPSDAEINELTRSIWFYAEKAKKSIAEGKKLDDYWTPISVDEPLTRQFENERQNKLVEKDGKEVDDLLSIEERNVSQYIASLAKSGDYEGARMEAMEAAKLNPKKFKSVAEKFEKLDIEQKKRKEFIEVSNKQLKKLVFSNGIKYHVDRNEPAQALVLLRRAKDQLPEVFNAEWADLENDLEGKIRKNDEYKRVMKELDARELENEALKRKIQDKETIQAVEKIDLHLEKENIQKEREAVKKEGEEIAEGIRRLEERKIAEIKEALEDIKKKLEQGDVLTEAEELEFLTLSQKIELEYEESTEFNKAVEEIRRLMPEKTDPVEIKPEEDIEAVEGVDYTAVREIPDVPVEQRWTKEAQASAEEKKDGGGDTIVEAETETDAPEQAPESKESSPEKPHKVTVKGKKYEIYGVLAKATLDELEEDVKNANSLKEDDFKALIQLWTAVEEEKMKERALNILKEATPIVMKTINYGSLGAFINVQRSYVEIPEEIEQKLLAFLNSKKPVSEPEFVPTLSVPHPKPPRPKPALAPTEIMEPVPHATVELKAVAADTADIQSVTETEETVDEEPITQRAAEASDTVPMATIEEAEETQENLEAQLKEAIEKDPFLKSIFLIEDSDDQKKALEDAGFECPSKKGIRKLVDKYLEGFELQVDPEANFRKKKSLEVGNLLAHGLTPKEVNDFSRGLQDSFTKRKETPVPEEAPITPAPKAQEAEAAPESTEEEAGKGEALKAKEESEEITGSLTNADWRLDDEKEEAPASTPKETAEPEPEPEAPEEADATPESTDEEEENDVDDAEDFDGATNADWGLDDDEKEKTPASTPKPAAGPEPEPEPEEAPKTKEQPKTKEKKAEETPADKNKGDEEAKAPGAKKAAEPEEPKTKEERAEGAAADENKGAEEPKEKNKEASEDRSEMPPKFLLDLFDEVANGDKNIRERLLDLWEVSEGKSEMKDKKLKKRVVDTMRLIRKMAKLGGNADAVKILGELLTETKNVDTEKQTEAKMNSNELAKYLDQLSEEHPELRDRLKYIFMMIEVDPNAYPDHKAVLESMKNGNEDLITEKIAKVIGIRECKDLSEFLNRFKKLGYYEHDTAISKMNDMLVKGELSKSIAKAIDKFKRIIGETIPSSGGSGPEGDGSGGASQAGPSNGPQAAENSSTNENPWTSAPNVNEAKAKEPNVNQTGGSQEQVNTNADQSSTQEKGEKATELSESMLTVMEHFGLDPKGMHPAVMAIRKLLLEKGDGVDFKQMLKFMNDNKLPNEAELMAQKETKEELREKKNSKKAEISAHNSSIQSLKRQHSKETDDTKRQAIFAQITKETNEKSNKEDVINDINKALSIHENKSTTETQYYRSSEQILAMMVMYHATVEAGENKTPDYSKILDETNNRIEAATTERATWGHRAWNEVSFGIFKPKLSSTLKAIAIKDPSLSKLKPEQLTKLASLSREGQEEIDNWIKNLEGGMDGNMTTVIPTLLGHIENAINFDGAVSHLNSFSIHRARFLSRKLRRSMHKYAINKAEKRGGKGVDKMSAYFGHINEMNITKKEISKKVTRKHMQKIMLQSGVMGVGMGAGIGAGASLVMGLAGLPLAAVGVGISATSAGVLAFKEKDEKTKAVLKETAKRAGLLTAGLAGLSALGASALVAAPLAVGGVFVPEYWKHRKKIAGGVATVGPPAVVGSYKLLKTVSLAALAMIPLGLPFLNPKFRNSINPFT